MIILYLQSTNYRVQIFRGNKDRRSYYWSAEFKSPFLKCKNEDYPYPSERVRVVNFTVQNFITETGFRNPGIRNPETTRVYNLQVP